ncbi:uncharacterized protein LOC129951803 [Eupeodes corollae]|uniref:uncharacterized protein LOC129951803 n=1 Tax=Eupeodes corollae TaxID=290404 RepID=UPI002491419E|nr:uncharacterized protein LOC129951803 [Eupeodes corollae]
MSLSNRVQGRIAIFNGENYSTWRPQMEGVLHKFRLLNIVQGKEERSPETKDEQEKWDDKDLDARSELLFAIEAQAVALYSNYGRVPAICAIISRLTELEAKRDDDILVVILLNSLDENYKDVRAAFAAQKDFPTLETGRIRLMEVGDTKPKLLNDNSLRVKDRPKNKNVIGCRWVFKTKRKPDGTIKRRKARLVAKGYSQLNGVDYIDTFAPVAEISSIRMLYAIAREFDLDLHHIDISTAFLYGDLNKEIFMEQPTGYVTDKSKVCKLQNSTIRPSME